MIFPSMHESILSSTRKGISGLSNSVTGTNGKWEKQKQNQTNKWQKPSKETNKNAQTKKNKPKKPTKQANKKTRYLLIGKDLLSHPKLREG